MELGLGCSLILSVAVILGPLVIHITQNYPLCGPFNCFLGHLGARAWVMACSMGQCIFRCLYADNYLTSKKILLDGEVVTVPSLSGFFYTLKFHKQSYILCMLLVFLKLLLICALIDKRVAKDLVRLLISQKINKHQCPKFTAIA